MTQIFVSHSSKDDPTVNQIHDTLSGANLATWIDHKRLITSEIFDDEIQAGLVNCTCGIFVLSEYAIKSKECLAEWRTLIDLGKRLFVVLIEKIDPKIFPYRLRVYQRAELHENFEAGLQKLVDDLQAKCADGAVSLDDVLSTTTTAARTTMPASPAPRLFDDAGKTLNFKHTRLIGRDQSLQAVKDLLKTRITIVIALGGSGKSRLAYEVATTGENIDHALWHFVEENASPEVLLLRLKTFVGLPKEAGEDDLFARLHDRHLIVVDNAESVTDKDLQAEYSQLIQKLAARGAQVLVTSRVKWESLDAATFNLTPLTLDEAEQVCLEMLNAGVPDPDLPAHARTIADAAKKHPRLIEWAVGQLVYLPLEQVLSDLNDLQSADAQNALFEMIGKTADQMARHEGEDARDALRKLNVCRGGFTYAAAGAILSADNQALSRWLKTLIAYGFVKLQGGRYEIDPLVNEALGTDPAAGSPHYDYYLTLARQHDERQDYYGLDVESANLDAAFAWAIGNDPEDALWLRNACGNFLTNRGRSGQRLEWIERVVAALADHPDKMLWANAQNSLGATLKNLPTGDRRDNLRRAVAAYEAALVYRTPQAAPLYYATTQNNLGLAYNDLAGIEDREANLRKAVAAYEAALVYRTPQAAPLDYAGTQNNLGNAYRDLAGIEDREENLRKAVAAYEAALEYRTPQAAPLGYALTQENVGLVYVDLSHIEAKEANLQRAVQAYNESLRFLTPAAAPYNYPKVQRHLGIALEEQGDLPAAITSWREAEKYYRLMGYIAQADEMLEWIADGEKRLNDGGA